MRLDGIHHITAITGDGPRNVDFYARVLGLRLVKKSVNQDDPTAYHLFYADEAGSHGADLTFFEYPGARRGRAGAGMVTRIVHRVGSDAALDYWAERLGGEGVEIERAEGSLRFADPEGLQHELAVVETTDTPLIARHREIPADFALQGFEAVVATVADPTYSELMVGQVLGFEAGDEHTFEARGPERGGRVIFEQSDAAGVQGAGTVHHIAWAAQRADLENWRARITQVGGRPSPVIDRFYFESVYFQEPSGILYELATADGNGFAVDEAPEHLGEKLSLPPDFEHLRAQVEPQLRRLPDTRQWRPAEVEV
jgi:glyoxalase family protein